MQAPEIVECGRHGLPWSPPNDPLLPWWTRRCAHFGDCFVVQIESVLQPRYVWVDFVRDIGVDVEVEDHAFLSADTSAIEEMWESLTERMRAGELPNPET